MSLMFYLGAALGSRVGTTLVPIPTRRRMQEDPVACLGARRAEWQPQRERLS